MGNMPLPCSGDSPPVRQQPICSHLIHRLLKTQCLLWFSPWEENTFECQDPSQVKLPTTWTASRISNFQHQVGLCCASGSWSVFRKSHVLPCISYIEYVACPAVTFLCRPPLPLPLVLPWCNFSLSIPSPEILSWSVLVPFLKALLPCPPLSAIVSFLMRCPNQISALHLRPCS